MGAERGGDVRRWLTRRHVVWTVVIVAAVGLLAWVFLGVGVSNLIDKILNLPSWLVLLLVFLLPFLEASIFVGVVVPGEIAVLLGGVVASQHKLSIVLVLIAACVGAVGGDQIGYVVGREWGEGLLQRVPDRLLNENRLRSSQDFIRRMGAKGVIVGRWTAALRALVPGLCGMARMHYVRFLAANVVGGVGWAVTIALIGYAAGDQYKKVQKTVGDVSYVLLGVLVVVVVAVHFVRKSRERKREAAFADDPGHAGDAGHADDAGHTVDEPAPGAPTP